MSAGTWLPEASEECPEDALEPSPWGVRQAPLYKQTLLRLDWYEEAAPRWHADARSGRKSTPVEVGEPQVVVLSEPPALRASHTAVGRYIVRHVRSRPSWILTRGTAVTIFVLAFSACASIVARVASALGAAAAMAVLGMTVLVDYAVRQGRPVVNLRLAAAMLVGGLGSFVVFVVALVT